MKSYQIKLIVVSSLYLLLFAGLIFFALFPVLNIYNQNKIDLKDKSAQLDTARSDFENLIKLKKDVAATEEIKKNVLSYLPDEKSTSDFVVKIESLSGDLSITIPSLTTVEPKTTVKPATEGDNKEKTTTPDAQVKTASNYVEFTLSFTADYPKVQEFIRSLNSLLRLNSLESINISANNPETGELEFRTTGRVYHGK